MIWDGENKIYLAVVIAAKSDEHLQVLQILTRALMHDVSEQVKMLLNLSRLSNYYKLSHYL